MKEFKNLFVYQLARDGLIGMALTHLPEDVAFTPCGPTQAKSVGFVPPRGDAHAALCEASDGHHIYKVMTEVRVVPGSAVKQRVDELCALIEDNTGRRPGRKQITELRDQALQELMPSVIPRQSATLIWIDRKRARLVVGTGSSARADEAVSLMVKVLPGLAVSHIQTEQAPAQAMSTWLLGDEPEFFTIDRQLLLVGVDEMRSSVRYDKHPLDLEEVRTHITRGKVPKLLAMTWMSRVSFVLTDTLQLKKIKLLDMLFEGTAAQPDKGDAFDADMAIFTGEVQLLLNNLIATLN